MVATTVVIKATKGVIQTSALTKRILAVMAVLATVAGIVFVDVPGNECAREFMSSRSFLTGVVTSLLILGAGLLAYDARAEKEREKHAASLRRQAFVQLSDAWDRTQKAAVMELDWESPVEQSDEYYNFVRESFDSAGIWLAVLANLTDDESLKCTRLVASYRASLTPLLSPRQKPRPLKQLTFQWGEAGLILEQLRYVCMEAASFRPKVSLAGMRPGLWEKATHTHPPGLYGAGREPPMSIGLDEKDMPGLFSDARATQAEKRAIVSRHGTFREGAHMWRIAELLARRNFERAEIAPPHGFNNYMDYLADLDKRYKDLLEARKRHVALLPRPQWRSLHVHVNWHPIRTFQTISARRRAARHAAEEAVDDNERK